MDSQTERSRPRILVTGASGFVGRHLLAALNADGYEYRLALRNARRGEDPRIIAIGDIGPSTEWRAALDGIDVVIHLAARAHVLREKAFDPRYAFMRVNADGTYALVASAAAAGVTRVIYLSSIGVHGNSSSGMPISEISPLRPHNLYAESKLEGEKAARSAAGSRLELVVVRPPLVYGTGVRANFLRLAQAVRNGWPLPFKRVNNNRSLVSVWNLCDLLLKLIRHPDAARQPWIVADNEYISTPDLIRMMANLMNCPARLVSVPPAVLRLGCTLIGRSAEFSALCDSLVLDASTTRSRLQWTPPLTLREGLRRTLLSVADSEMARSE